MNNSVIIKNNQNYLINLPDNISVHSESLKLPILLFAHGAGAGMESDFIDIMVRALIQYPIKVVRFEFPYMQQQRLDNKKRFPNKKDVLIETWKQAIKDWQEEGPLYIGGKSLGGRMATMAMTKGKENQDDDQYDVNAVFCLGYPFHPPRNPDKWRLDHFSTIGKDTFIFQGERDPFGSYLEIQEMEKKKAPWRIIQNGNRIPIHWVLDGDHDFKPRKKSGTTQVENIKTVAKLISQIMIP